MKWQFVVPYNGTVVESSNPSHMDKFLKSVPSNKEPTINVFKFGTFYCKVPLYDFSAFCRKVGIGCDN